MDSERLYMVSRGGDFVWSAGACKGIDFPLCFVKEFHYLTQSISTE